MNWSYVCSAQSIQSTITYTAGTNENAFWKIQRQGFVRPAGILPGMPARMIGQTGFQRKGFPKGKLGVLLETLYEIKINGLEELLDPLKR